MHINIFNLLQLLSLGPKFWQKALERPEQGLKNESQGLKNESQGLKNESQGLPTRQ